MSRVGKKPVALPNDVEVNVDTENSITVKGPKGELTYALTDKVNVEIKDKEIVITPVDESKVARCLNGTHDNRLNNQ